MEDFIGQEIGGCKIEKKLGQGGMGAVYQGTQVSLGREVAVKVIAEAYMTNEQAVARFEREARSVAVLNHPNIVQVYDLGRTESGQYYIVMEFVDGKSISDILKTTGAFPERESMTMIRQAAKGLEAAAEKQIIHRDIKPDNLMVTTKGVVKVADFGLAKDVGSASQLTATGHVMGTPAYIAPEQGDGRPSDHRSDIYSLGATFFAMLTGDMPYTGETPIAIVLQHIQAPVPDPKEKNPELSDEVCSIVKKMMAKEPDQRYQSVRELIHDIDVVLGVGKDGDRLIAEGAAMAFDDQPTLLGQSINLQDGKAETLLEVSSPTPQTIDAGKIRAPGAGAPPASRKGLWIGLGAGALLVAAAIVLGLVFFEDLFGEKPSSNGGAASTPGTPEPGDEPGAEVSTPGDGQGGDDASSGTGETPSTPGPSRPRIDVNITMPATGSFHRAKRILVKGRTRGAEAASLTINGEPAPLSAGGAFRKAVTLKEGVTDLKVVAEGENEAYGEDVLTVIVDTVRPVLSFPDVSEGGLLRTNRPSHTVRGTLDDLNPSKVTVDGVTAALEEGAFSHEVFLEEGLNRIRVTAEDKAGNSTTRLIKILHDPHPPEIRLEGVPSRVQQSDPTLEIRGTVSETLEGFEAAGRETPVSDGAFRIEVSLSPGPNRFTFRARDLAGNESEKSVEIEYTPLPAGLKASAEEGIYLFEKDGARMASVPAGNVTIGRAEDRPEEGPPHAVTLSPFYMDLTEVTNAQYGKFLEALEAAGNPRAFSHPDEPEGKDHTPAFYDDPEFNAPEKPVVGVDWYDAYAYATWAGKSLPTEAQWEAAARAGFGGDAPTYPWGDEPPAGRANFGDEIGATAPVGSWPRGATKTGLLDMGGNVQEWCLDWYDPAFYASPEATAPDPVNAKPSRTRVMRGGHWQSPPERLRCAARSFFFPEGRYDTVGFRCVLAVNP